MKVIELLKSKEWSGKVIDCVLRFALSFALALAQVFGGYAPLALGMIGASGAGLRGVSALRVCSRSDRRCQSEFGNQWH